MNTLLSYARVSGLLMILAVLSGCGVRPEASAALPAGPTPTISPLFLEPPTPTATAVPSPESSPTARPARPTAAPSPEPDEQIAEVAVYEDALAPGWSLSDSQNMRVTPNEQQVVYQGKRAIMAEPTGGTGQVQFSLRKTSNEVYSRDKVLGVSFWVSGGSSIVAPEDLAVTVLGSNKYSYWVAGDTSVDPLPNMSAEWPLFSETRLYFLGFNQSIPANTWAEVVLWLDEREFDPLYSYVTGLYIKNDERRSEPFYIDNVQLLVRNDAGS